MIESHPDGHGWCRVKRCNLIEAEAEAPATDEERTKEYNTEKPYESILIDGNKTGLLN